MADHASWGDDISARRSLLEAHVADVDQLFNQVDPSPFHDRDLDRNVEEFIVEWSTDFPADAPLALVVHVRSRSSCTTGGRYVGRRASSIDWPRRRCASTPTPRLTGAERSDRLI